MNIDIKDIIKLDDNTDYIVLSKVIFNNDIYYYLIDKKLKKTKIVMEKDDYLIEKKLREVDKKVLSLFLEELKKVEVD